VLFNGGLFESPAIQRRVIEALETWFRTPATPDWTPRRLAHHRLDLAVARGAAYYGMVRRGEGVRIAATLRVRITWASWMATVPKRFACCRETPSRARSSN
jgi:hypothetical protein